jgi:hypothetical protein
VSASRIAAFGFFNLIKTLAEEEEKKKQYELIEWMKTLAID